MTISVATMIIIGLILIIASFFISEKRMNKEENFNIDLITVDDNYEFSERELQIIKRKIEDVIAKQAKDILYETNESLSTMANEKTMALGDYAVAVCDEIEKNHKEAMFLYSMLDDKQKEIMNTVNVVDEAKQGIKEMISGMEHPLSMIKEESKEAVKKKSAIDQLTALSKTKKDMEQDEEMAYRQKKSEEKFVKKATEQKTAEQKDDTQTVKMPEQREKQSEPAKDKKSVPEPDTDLEDIFAQIDETDIGFDEMLEEEFKENGNSNDIILEMHKNGSSIIEIAKQLGLGVGEVKLVIDLYQGE